MARKIKNRMKKAAFCHGRMVIFLWVLQLLTLGWLFANLTWDNYWLCRGVYRPGLMFFQYLAGGILPGHYFSPISRTGVMTGFAFASLLYAVIAYFAFRLMQVMPFARR